MEKSDFLIIAEDFIKNFDDKNISISIIAVLGRGGSLLLQSFFDSHDQILMIPTILPIYQNWSNKHDNELNYEETVNSFFNSNIFKTNWFIDKLGKDRNYNFDLKLDLLEKKTLEIFNLVPFSRKNFILSLHLAYSYIFNINISKIKSIVLHEHYFGSFSAFERIKSDSLFSYTNHILSNQSNLFEKVKSDFKNVIFLLSIRNPYDSFLSFMKLMKNDSHIIKSDRFWTHIQYIFLLFRDIKELIFDKQVLNTNEFMFIEFEKLHSNTKELMIIISNLIGIDYKNSLLESTIQNQIWWGNSPTLLINGATKERDIYKWKKELTKEEIDLLSFSFETLLEVFNYEFVSQSKKSFEEVYFFPQKEFEGFILNLFLYSNTSKIEELYDVNSYLWIEMYPFARKNLFSFIKKDKLFLDLNNDINYKGIDFCIQYKFNSNSILSNGYLICFQPWLYTSITLEQIKYLNTLVDQIWVPSEFIKNNYIDSGVIPSKIKVINYGIDAESSSEKIKEINDEYLCSDSFKFIYQGNLRDVEVLDNIILSLRDVFNNNEDILLILLDSEYLDNYMKKDYKPFEEINKEFFKIRRNENIKFKVYFDYKNISNLNEIYKKADCFIYPYNKESIGISILRAANNEIPIITTGDGVSLEILDNDTSYLINAKFEESNINSFNNIGLVYNHQDLKIDREHLKNLIKEVYFNRLDSKNKAKKAKESVLKKYNWSNTMLQIDNAINELKIKPILRYNLNKIIDELELDANKSFEQKDYFKAKNIYYELSKYNSSNIDYLYKLAICYFQLGEYENSLENFIEVLENKLPDFELLNFISINLFNIGDYENSKLYKEKALELFS